MSPSPATLLICIILSLNAFAQKSTEYDELKNLDKKLDDLLTEREYEKRFSLFNQKANIYIQLKDWDGYASNLCQIGMNHWQIGNYLNMKVFLDSALVTAEREKLNTNSDVYGTIWSYYGFFHNEMGDISSTLDAFKKTLAIDKELYKIYKENKNAPEVENFDTTYLAYDYISIGHTYSKKGDYEEARDNFYEALSYIPEDDLQRAKIYNNIGYSYDREKSFDNAKKYYYQGIEYLVSKESSVDKEDMLILLYNNLASLYVIDQLPDSSYYFLDRLYNLINNEQRESDLADYYQILADTDLSSNKYDAAINHSEKALDLKRTIFGENHPTVAISYNVTGKVYASSGDHKEALQYYQKALIALVSEFESTSYSDNPSIRNEINNRLLLLTILRCKVISLRAINQPQAAQSTLQLAIQLIDQIRYNYLAEGSKYALLERAMPIYEQAIDLAIEMNEHEWALEVAERSKATLLLESIKNSEAQTFAGISEDLLEQEREQKVQIAFYERLLNEAKRGEDRKKYQRKIFELRQKYQAFLEELEQVHPEYYELKYQLEYPSISDLQGKLLNNKTALMEYFTGDSSIYLFVITKQDLQILKVKRSTTFEGNLNKLRKSLEKVTTNGFEDFTSSSHFLYSNFFQAALKKLPTDINQLILIPDGQLSYIPFQALIKYPVNTSTISDPRYDTLSYLVHDYAISYAYSINLLLKNEARKSNHNLVFGGFAPIFSGGLSGEDTLSELPHSRKEIENGYSLLGGLTFFQSDASLKNFKEQADQVDILHLSTHAAVEDGNPNQSRIHFHDNYLTVNEIYNLPIRANLTVLSACETGIGKYKRGEGMLSLGRAFMYAGCPSLVTSLWQVNDEKTADLMLTFYEELLEKRSKDKALQQAQINYLKTASMEAAHPFYWAAFVQVGDQEAIVGDGFGWVWWLGIGIIVLVLLILYLRR